MFIDIIKKWRFDFVNNFHVFFIVLRHEDFIKMYKVFKIILKKVINIFWVISWTRLNNIGDFILLLIFNNSIENFIKTVNRKFNNQKLWCQQWGEQSSHNFIIFMLQFDCGFMKILKELKKVRYSVSSTKVIKTVRKYLQFLLILKQFELKILLRGLKVCVLTYLLFCSYTEIHQYLDKLLLWFEIKWRVNVIKQFTETFTHFLCVLFDHFWTIT